VLSTILPTFFTYKRHIEPQEEGHQYPLLTTPCLYIGEKNCLFVGVGTQKSLLQREKMCLLGADHGKAFLLLKLPSL
jgi:hypothetical protein